MGKKRKAIEISEEDRIQTVLIRSPYGYHDPDTWDAQDRNRRDDGLYVAVEWLEFIFGGQGAPGSLQVQRTRGPAVEEIWTWNGRTDLLVSIRRDIDLAPQLGKHPYSVFLRNPPRVGGDSRASLITRAKYQSAEQIVGMGEGWKPVSSTPFTEVPLIRKHKFVNPYPSPGSPIASQHTRVNPVKSEDSKDIKLPVKHEEADSKPVRIKQEIKQEIHSEVPNNDVSSAHTSNGKLDVKPVIPQHLAQSGLSMTAHEGSSAPPRRGLEAPGHSNAFPVKAEDPSIKGEEDIGDMIRRAQARREEDRRAALATSSSSFASRPDYQQTQSVDPVRDRRVPKLGPQASPACDVDRGKHGVDGDLRQAKRVKKEEPNW